MSTPEPSPQRTVGFDGKSYPGAAPEHATDGSAQPVNAGGKRDTRFKAGNPGKPKGTRHRATLIAEALIDGSGELLVKKCVEMALGGDAAAMRLVMERLCPPRRERPVCLAMPNINAASDLIGAAAALTDAVAEGEVTRARPHHSACSSRMSPRLSRQSSWPIASPSSKSRWPRKDSNP